ncbi:MAG: SDR family oxidoreductase [Deltaproteobacteria bacterium]|nr:MAG: SDR family oxidoreductase [Deltaproteobacteria bacterium]
MDREYLENLFDLSGKVAAITGGGGVLCGTLSRALARLGVRVAVLDILEETAQRVANDIVEAGGKAIALRCDVLDKTSLEAARDAALSRFGRVDILINGAGGNKQQASTSSDLSFFDLPYEALRWVFDLNLLGTLLPSQIFGKSMVEQDGGSVLNISSMNAFRPLTRTPAYAAAKAGVSNFTQWLAVHMAQEYSPNIRVNAIAPGFFLTEQNRFLLTDDATGSLTPRGETIAKHTPMGRFGGPEDLIGTVVWLLSPAASSFVTGIVVPVDGGFNAFSGV